MPLRSLPSQILQSALDRQRRMPEKPAHAFSTTDGLSQVGKVLRLYRPGALRNLPRSMHLLDLHIVRNILDQLVNGRLVPLVGSKARGVEEIDDGSLFQ